jgi:hypothetical protein
MIPSNNGACVTSPVLVGCVQLPHTSASTVGRGRLRLRHISAITIGASTWYLAAVAPWLRATFDIPVSHYLPKVNIHHMPRCFTVCR